ncbi:MAG: heavy metal translocating P-type ATPase metal-binding domain-containing protein, partial [Saprospiraceae bacterium]|nr:heavy metal translocating P-type ATPase metal-binding domain-containing protein [Saprospiraceae bacterium]
MSFSADAISHSADTEYVCDHCKDFFVGDLVRHQDKVFCCRGCRSVYLILSENDLLNYYALNDAPGISLRGQRVDDYHYLDAPDIKDRLLDYADDRREKVSLLLPQIHCSSCLWLLENLHRFNPGILNVRVHYVKKEAFITYDPQTISLSSVALLLSNLGYAPAISLYDLDRESPKRVDRSLPLKMAVAAFSFGNIMLFSFPEYLGLSASDGDQDFSKLFGYLNLVLALPVLLYSARDILMSAWRGVRSRALNMDIPLSIGILSIFSQSTFEVL